MKTFFVAALLFSLLVGVIIYNFFALNDISDRLILMTDALPPPEDPNCVLLARQLAEEWEASRDFISFSCGLSKLDIITDLTDQLCFYAEIGASNEFELTRRLLINAFEDIAELESLRLEDIF